MRFILKTILISLFLLPSFANASLVSYLPMDSRDYISSTVIKDRTDSNNGTLVNSPTKVVGKIGQALGFSTNKYVTITNTVNLPFPAAGFRNGAVSFWFKFNNLTDVTKGIFSVGSVVADTNPPLLIQQNTSSISVYSNNMGYWGSSVVNLKWHHIVVTNNGTSDSFYLDGVPITGGAQGSTVATSSTIYIGTGYNGYFNGSIDDVRIYNTNLTYTQIKQLYRLGVATHSGGWSTLLTMLMGMF